MSNSENALLASYPWLTATEAAAVYENLPSPIAGVPATELIRTIAEHLEERGLPPTSSLLLTLAGRGSKTVAVRVSREIARRRFERAAGKPNPTTVVTSTVRASSDQIEVAQSSLSSAVYELRALVANAQSPDTAPILASIAGDVAWLKSTIDTERQLHRYQAKYGPLTDIAVQGATDAAQRRTKVGDLTSSLEAVRFKGDATPPARRDFADAPDE